MNLTREFFKRITDLGSLVSMGVIGILFLLTDFTLFLRLLISVGVSFGIIATVRMNYYKNRPFKTKKPNNVLGIVAESSFPSVHASNAMAFAFAIGLSTSQNLFIFFLVLAFTVVISRHYLKKHYVIDLAVGSLLGALMGIIAFLIT